MRINSINASQSLSFKSLRTDKKEVEVLRSGKMPILENQKENILTALNNLSTRPNRETIEFLMDVSAGLQYGQQSLSEYKDEITRTTDIEGDLENTKWSEILTDTIKKALNNSKEYVGDLRDDFELDMARKQSLTPDQKEILSLRNGIKSIVSHEDALEDSETLIRVTDISKNLDYFISSSEISIQQKKRSLELINEFLRGNYKIDPQLEDKKIQILDELLKDLVVKTPEDEKLTTKAVNQLYTGMCGAISLCRKEIAYEDKVRYIELIMEELKDSPTMEVFDVTKLGTGAKVNIPKIHIDYNDAISQGYRILDAAAHNWMHNAHTSGDGTIQSETYTAFDRNAYGLFNDTSWYEGMNPEFSMEKELLKRLIKEKETLEAVQNTRKKQKGANEEIIVAKRQAVEIQSKINGLLNEAFSTLFPELSQTDITKLQKSLIKFYTGSKENNEINVADKLPKEVKARIITDYILQQVPEAKNREAQIQKEAGNIISLMDTYIAEDANIKKLSSFDTKKAKYTYYKKLFNLAAAHRLAIEADVNLKDGVVRFEKISGLPTRDIQVTSYLKTLQTQLKQEIPTFIDSTEKTQEEIEKELVEDIIKIESVLPSRIDSVLKNLIGQDVKGLTKEIFEDTAKKIEQGDPDNLERASFFFGVKKDKTTVLKFINKKIEKLNGNISDKELQEYIRLLGFENRTSMAQMFVSAYMSSLQQGISEEEYNGLCERFGGKDKVGEGINAERENFIKIIEEYNRIFAKWNVPSTRELILEKMEKQNSILTRKKLDNLQRHFENVRTKSKKNDTIQNIKARTKANEELYNFTPDQIEIFNVIEKRIPEIKKYCKMEYDAITKVLFDDLEKQYANIGMMNGQFWVREEGSTGLAANEQLRITEQITGKPYHIQYDIEKAAEQIKRGKGSGVVSYSVDDSSYAFHAMYSPVVTTETFTNPITGEKKPVDIFWTDNSWGDVEKEYFWNGKNGFEYTDYGQGMGWENGFVISKDGKIGLPVSEMKNALGVNTKNKEKFGLVLETILPGMPINAYQKLYKMFGYILTMNQGEEFLQQLESFIKKGEKIDIKYLNNLDEIAEKRTDAVWAQMEKIKTKEDFDKLPDDNYLKLVMSILAVHLSTNNPELADSVLIAQTLEEVEDYKKEFFSTHTDELAAIIGKTDDCLENLMLVASEDLVGILKESNEKFGTTFNEIEMATIIEGIFFNEEELKKLDGTITNLEKYLMNQVTKIAIEKFENEDALKFFIENSQNLVKSTIDKSLKIKSLDSPVLTNSPLGEEFIAAVDKYLNPASDKEMLDFVQGMQFGNYELADKFIAFLKPEDVGLDFKHPFEYIEKLRAEDSGVYKAFAEVVASNVISTELSKRRPEEESDLATPEDLYRGLYVKLAEMDVQKFIKKFKAEAFAKYKVRQAFPQPVVLPDEEICKTTEAMFGAIEEIAASIKATNLLIEIFDKYETIMQKGEDSQLFQDIKAKRNIEAPTQTAIKAAQELKTDLEEFYNLIQADESIKLVSDPIKILIEELSFEDGQISGRIAGRALNDIIKIFDSWEKSGIYKAKFVQQREEELKDMRENLQLMVFTNIDPAYRDRALHKLNKVLSLIRKEAPLDEIEQAKDDYMDLAIEKHIIKNPTELLKECVKLLQAGKEETDDYQILKKYLLEALKVAQQTKIQYKLVQNAHEGISSKTRDLLPLFNVTLTDGRKESMVSEMGMLYIIEQLKNASEDHTTMKLFLDQAGLSQLALQAVLNNFKMEETIKMVDENYKVVMQEMDDLNKLNSVISEFLDKSRIKYLSFDQAVEQMINYVNRKMGKDPDNIALKEYIEYMSNVKSTEEVRNLSSSMIGHILRSINEDAVANSTQKINLKIDFISDVSKLLGDRCELVNIIEVPETSDVYKQKQAFYSEYDKTQQYIGTRLEEITKKIENLPFLSADYRK